MSPFADLKPGDKVVYYQWHFRDQWPHAGVSTVKSHDEKGIVLNEISGWTFRVEDGNPVGYDENPVLCTYIVPTTPALIERVLKQKASIEEYHRKKRYLNAFEWGHANAYDIDQAYEVTPEARKRKHAFLPGGIFSLDPASQPT